VECTLEDLFRTAFASVVGVDLRTELAENAYRGKSARGGMSSGQVCLSNWRDRLIPLLVRRARRT